MIAMSEVPNYFLTLTYEIHLGMGDTQEEHAIFVDGHQLVNTDGVSIDVCQQSR